MNDAERLRRARELFDAAVDLPPPERRAFLEAQAGSEPELVAEVSALIAEAERTAPGLPSRLEEGLPPSRADAAALVGQRLGAYDVVRLEGLGGMGAVYEGRRADDQYHKRVAIKLVQGDLHSPPTLARFRRERQILASLQHRNIATLLDGGVSPDGRPFLVMEYVEGEPITTWCDRRSLTVAQRIALFRQVCEAVRHAHRNLVIHRDLKPGNILVTPEGDVKLLDFGVAKLLGPDAEEEMPLTRGGARAFTPEYASPEQIRGETLTTASDVYSMGVVLYELLAGRRPHVGGGSVAAIERAVLEAPIARPSAVVTDEAARRCGERGARHLRRRLAGELDSIVMLALRPEPELRWASAEALAEDLRRYLDGRPVAAQRGWRGYRFRKFLQRNRVPVAAGALVLIVLIGGIVATGIQADRARQEQARAERVSGFLTDLLESVRPMTGGRDVPVSELLDAAAQRVATEMADQPEARAELEGVIGQSYLALGRFDEAERHLRKALDDQQRLHGARSEPALVALTWLGGVYLGRGDIAPADSIVRRSLEIAQTLPSQSDSLVANLLEQLGSVAHGKGDVHLAERAHRQALEIRRRVFGPRSDPVVTSTNNLAVALGEQGKWAEAESLHRVVLAIEKVSHPPPSTEVADAENALASVLDFQNKYDEAESLYADVLRLRGTLFGRDNPEYAFTLMNYAMFIFDRGRYTEAADLSRQLLALRGKTLPESHPAIATSLQTLGRCLDRLGEHDSAGRVLAESFQLRSRYVGRDSWLTASSESVLGDHEIQMHDYPKAERYLLEADATLSKALGPDHPRTITNLRRIVALYEAWPKPERATRYQARLAAAPH
jgi:serine/threonine-protein kinase